MTKKQNKGHREITNSVEMNISLPIPDKKMARPVETPSTLKPLAHSLNYKPIACYP